MSLNSILKVYALDSIKAGKDNSRLYSAYINSAATPAQAYLELALEFLIHPVTGIRRNLYLGSTAYTNLGRLKVLIDTRLGSSAASVEQLSHLVNNVLSNYTIADKDAAVASAVANGALVKLDSLKVAAASKCIVPEDLTGLTADEINVLNGVLS